MKFKNRIAITRRGYRMLGKYCPGLIRGKVIIAVLEALAPLVTVWFSARIINEIEGNRDTGTLILLVLLVQIFQTIGNNITKKTDKRIR